MTTIYVVQFVSRDGSEPQRPCSVWSNWDDAECAACEAAAMDPEDSYCVRTLTGDDAIAEFWFHNPQL